MTATVNVMDPSGTGWEFIGDLRALENAEGHMGSLVIYGTRINGTKLRAKFNPGQWCWYTTEEETDGAA